MPDPRQSRPQGSTHDPRGEQAFEIKGSVFTLSVLHLYTDDPRAVERELAGRPADAVAFFRNAPVVIDLHGLRHAAAPDFAALAQVLRAHHLIPVGVRGAHPAQESLAIAAGLGLLQAGRQPRETKPAAAPQAAAEPPMAPPQASKTITQPVRSGQQIYAQGGDLTVLATVSPGAEILADGHIHVYGALRGRALAGIRGDDRARIFCQSLEAELVSVAGHYRMLENTGEEFWGCPAQVYLADNKLLIEPL